MAAIRNRNTKPELLLRRALRTSGLRGYRVHHPGLPGKPDIAFTRWKLAIFVDGAYWHGHPEHYSFGRLGEYWDTKIRRTQERDRFQQAALEAAGYQVIRFWDFEVLARTDRCLRKIRRTLRVRVGA